MRLFVPRHEIAQHVLAVWSVDEESVLIGLRRSAATQHHKNKQHACDQNG